MKLEVRGKGAFREVYLPDRRLMRVARELERLGFNVNVYAFADNKAIDTRLSAWKELSFDDANAKAIVEASVSTGYYRLEVWLICDTANPIVYAYADRYPEPKSFIDRVKWVLENYRSIIEEHVGRIDRFGGLLRKLGFKRVRVGSDMVRYVKYVKDYKVYVTCYVVNKNTLCNIEVAWLANEEEIAGVAGGLESLLSKLLG